MTNVKAAMMGALVGLSGFFGGVSLAKAECSQGSYAAAVADADEGNRRGDHCEVIELQNGEFEAQCDTEAFPELADACVYVAETTVDCESTYTTSQSCDDAMGQVYEACMVIGVHTGAVHQ